MILQAYLPLKSSQFGTRRSTFSDLDVLNCELSGAGGRRGHAAGPERADHSLDPSGPGPEPQDDRRAPVRARLKEHRAAG